MNYTATTLMEPELGERLRYLLAGKAELLRYLPLCVFGTAPFNSQVVKDGLLLWAAGCLAVSASQARDKAFRFDRVFSIIARALAECRLSPTCSTNRRIPRADCTSCIRDPPVKSCIHVISFVLDTHTHVMCLWCIGGAS